MRRTLAPALFTLLLVAAPAGWSAPAPLSDEDASLVERWASDAKPSFTLGAGEGAFDPALQPEVERLLGELHARLRPLLTQWLSELHETPQTEPLSQVLFRRYIAALTAWRIDPLDARDDARWSAAAQAPQSCLTGQAPLLAQAFNYLRDLPPDQRADALAAEHQRASRFGQSLGAGSTHAPLIDEDGQLRRAVGTIKAAGRRSTPPLTPLLSDLWLSADYASPRLWQERCAAAQWWAALPDTGVDAAGRLAVLRYAMAPQALDYFQPPGETRPQAPANGPPPIAERFNVSGQLKVEIELDAAGTIRQARVVARSVQVPGLGALSPAAFETIFDAATLARVRAASFAPPEAEQLKAGVATVSQDYLYNIR